MWKDHKTLNRIPESISGCLINGSCKVQPYYVRYNGLSGEASALEYSTTEPDKTEISEDIYQTSAGMIEMYDEGEFGGCLKIGGKQVLEQMNERLEQAGGQCRQDTHHQAQQYEKLAVGNTLFAPLKQFEIPALHTTYPFL